MGWGAEWDGMNECVASGLTGLLAESMRNGKGVGRVGGGGGGGEEKELREKKEKKGGGGGS